MIPHKGRAAPESGPGALLGGVQRKYIPTPLQRQASAINATIYDALKDIDPADRTRLCRWLIERGLIGLAKTSGITAAAAHGYRLADVLAGGVQ